MVGLLYLWFISADSTTRRSCSEIVFMGEKIHILVCPCKPMLFKSQMYSTVYQFTLEKNQLILVQKYLIFTPELGFKPR